MTKSNYSWLPAEMLAIQKHASVLIIYFSLNNNSINLSNALFSNRVYKNKNKTSVRLSSPDVISDIILRQGSMI